MSAIITSSGVTPDAAMRSWRSFVALFGLFRFRPELGLAPPCPILIMFHLKLIY